MSFLALAAALVLTYFVPTSGLATMNESIRLLLSIVFVGLPVFFASVCFAILFRERSRPDVAFGWNLLGAVAGGLLEFSSMAIGLKSLTLALAAYLLAFLIEVRRVLQPREMLS